MHNWANLVCVEYANGNAKSELMHVVGSPVPEVSTNLSIAERLYFDRIFVNPDTWYIMQFGPNREVTEYGDFSNHRVILVQSPGNSVVSVSWKKQVNAGIVCVCRITVDWEGAC